MKRKLYALLMVLSLAFGISAVVQSPADAAPAFPGWYSQRTIYHPGDAQQRCQVAWRTYDGYGHGRVESVFITCYGTSQVKQVQTQAAFGDAYGNYYVGYGQWANSGGWSSAVSTFGYSALNGCVRAYFSNPWPAYTGWVCHF